MKNRIIIFLFAISISLGEVGCSTVTVVSRASEGDVVLGAATRQTLHRWFFGYIWNHKFLTDCLLLQRVNVRTTFWEGLVSVGTLGIYTPVDIVTICATIPPRHITRDMDSTQIKP